MAEKILEVQHLKTYFYQDGAVVRAADDLSYDIHAGECVAIIGESGSGKSVSAMSILGLIADPPGRIEGGKILFHGKDLLELDDEELAEIRGSKISMIFQEPSTALNPVMTVGKQVSEPLRVHKHMNKKEATEKAVEALRMVNIPNPEERVKQYPFEFSGGMQQRVMIAMAMTCEPELLIADEPTTALDVTIQAQVLEELNKLRREKGTALLLITHNLGVVARYADTVKIMYGGKIVEEGTADDIFRDPHHPYTMGLIRAVPRLDRPRSEGLYTIKGDPPDMSKIQPDCCAFADRCPYADEHCRSQRPTPEVLSQTHKCSCWHQEYVRKEREDIR